MHTTIDITDILLRLAAAVAAGGIIGFDRGSRGRVAGMRTTILLCLAACGAMIEANLTLSVVGKSNTSFAMMDALRFPLGILTGIGFIGAGAILKKGSIVTGVTTAATMWLVTVLGLVLGGGYFILGGCLTVLAVGVLALAHLEGQLARDHSAVLTVELARDGMTDEELRQRVLGAGYRIARLSLTHRDTRQMRMDVIWRAVKASSTVPPLVEELSATHGTLACMWVPQDTDRHE